MVQEIKTFKLSSASEPSMRFEYHPVAKTVYLIRLGSLPLIGDSLVKDVPNVGMAQEIVRVFLRGVKEGRAMGPQKLQAVNG